MGKRQRYYPGTASTDKRTTEGVHKSMGAEVHNRRTGEPTTKPSGMGRLPPEIWKIVFEYAGTEDLKKFCLVNQVFSDEAKRALWRHIYVDLGVPRRSKALLNTLMKGPALSRYIRSINFRVPSTAAAQWSFRTVLGYLPIDILSSICFHPSSRLSDFSMMVYIQFLLGVAKISKAMIPDTYSQSDREVLVPPEEMPSVAYRITYSRENLHQILFLGEENSPLVEIFSDGHAPIIGMDIWGQPRGPRHAPMIDEAMMALLNEHKTTIRSIRFSGIAFSLDSPEFSRLVHEGYPSLEELHIRNCWNNQLLLQAPRFLENLRTLFVEDLSTPKSPCCAEALEEIVAGLPALESLGLHVQIASFENQINGFQGERTTEMLAYQPDLRKMLHTHRDSLKRLILKFGGVKSDYDYVTPAVETCHALTHLGFPEPVISGNPMKEGIFTPDWRYHMSDIKQYLMYSNIRNVHIMFPTPHQMRPVRFNDKKTSDRHRIVAQEISDIMNKDLDEQPGIHCVSVTMRSRKWYTGGYPLPRTRSFRLSGDIDLIEDEETIWTESGGYPTLIDCMRAEFRHF